MNPTQAEDEDGYYRILELETIEVTKDEISKQYKKLALKYHPDKNRGDPKAADKFNKIRVAVEVLTEDKKREEYDNKIRAFIAKKKREGEMDSKRRKMKADLEERESKFKRQKQEEAAQQESVKEAIERLRKEGIDIMTKMNEDRKVKRQEQMKPNSLKCSLKVTWDRKKSDYSKDKLQQLFREFGDLDYIVVNQVKKKKGSAMVNFKTPSAAATAARQTLGDSNNRLTISHLDPTPVESNSTHYEEPTNLNETPAQSVSLEEHLDFESQMLKKMMEAATRQKDNTV